MKPQFWCFILCAALLASGCSSIMNKPAPVAGYELEIRPAVEKADPEAAIKAIYASLEEYGSKSLTAKELEKLTDIKPADLEEIHAYYSDAKSGLADVMILKPASDSRDKVRESLYLHKERRIKEFENYNILSAHDIAQNALIYDQGEYVILLMLDDNDAAKTVIDEYIPQ